MHIEVKLTGKSADLVAQIVKDHSVPVSKALTAVLDSALVAMSTGELDPTAKYPSAEEIGLKILGVSGIREPVELSFRKGQVVVISTDGLLLYGSQPAPMVGIVRETGPFDSEVVLYPQSHKTAKLLGFVEPGAQTAFFTNDSIHLA